MKKFFISLAIFFIPISMAKSVLAQNQQPIEVRFSVRSTVDPENYFPYQLLLLALEKSQREYTIERVDPLSMGIPDHDQDMVLASRPDIINVRVSGTSIDKETRLSPVYFPIYRGLLGYRVFAIRAEDQTSFNEIESFEQLKNKVALQGDGWTDVEILRKAGFRVMTDDYQNLYTRLRNEDVDFFPRAITEVFEIEAIDDPNIVLEKSLYIHYPLVLYFFVSPKEIELHNALTIGLVRALDDGSYQNLFEQNLAAMEMISRVQMDKRRGFKIETARQSETTKNLPIHYLYSVDEIIRLGSE